MRYGLCDTSAIASLSVLVTWETPSSSRRAATVINAYLLSEDWDLLDPDVVIAKWKMGTCQVEKVVEESQVGEGEVETLCRRLKGLCHGQVGHSSVRRHIFGQAPGGLICLCGIYAFQALEQTIVAAGTRLLTLPTRQNSFTGPTQTP